jgi:hypothetical protein
LNHGDGCYLRESVMVEQPLPSRSSRKPGLNGAPRSHLLGKNTDPENKGLSKFDSANKGLSDAYPEGESAREESLFPGHRRYLS